MPSNREVLYISRMRNQASEVVRQLSADALTASAFGARNPVQDQAHQKGMAREVKEVMRAVALEEMQNSYRVGGAARRMAGGWSIGATNCADHQVTDNGS